MAYLREPPNGPIPQAPTPRRRFARLPQSPREGGLSSTPRRIDLSHALWNTGFPAFAGYDERGGNAMNPSTMLRAFLRGSPSSKRNGKAFSGIVRRGRRLSRRVLRRPFEGRAKIAGLIRPLVLSDGDRFSLGHARPRQRRTYALCALHVQLPLDAAGSGRRARDVAGRCDHAAARRQDHGVPRGRHHTAPAFVDIKFAPERIAKIVAKQGAALKARPEMKRHLVE